MHRVALEPSPLQCSQDWPVAVWSSSGGSGKSQGTGKRASGETVALQAALFSAVGRLGQSEGALNT